MKVLALDPGTDLTAWVLLCDGQIRNQNDFAHESNAAVLNLIGAARSTADLLAVEMIASYGMPVGREVFETCLWIGRYIERWHGPYQLVYRREVKAHLCHSAKANDAAIRQALLDRYGPGRDKAVGTKKAPGPLYGVSGDVWAALAVAVTVTDGAELKEARRAA